jgi:hypothetical protein
MDLSQNSLIEIIDSTYRYVKSVYGINITASNVVVIASNLIQVVEKYKDLPGNQKKLVVISTIKMILQEQTTMSETDKMAINVIIDSTLPTVIDNLILAINGGMKFDKESIKKKYLCCF